MITALISLKGGVGKSTSAFFLACVALKNTKKPVLVIDGDNEHSLVSWFSRLEKPPERLTIEPASPDSLAKQALAAKSTGAYVFIDCPPNHREMLHRAASIANHVIVPVKPTGLDLDRLRSTLELLADVDASRQTLGSGLDVGILFTHWQKRRKVEAEALEALHGFPLLETKIRMLEAYKEAFSSIPTYLEEYQQLWKEIGLGR
jgi:chromosome partitioning protein